ncbi:hypothetical protein [Pseudarthrobacter sp. PvP090]|uniref:hypothetical protein n=1 Tax=Pseudarthrobacter sp. PvP090 TaxID=3156393 RepID=UPI003396FE22
MARSKIAVRSGKGTRSRRFKKLPVPVSKLRWALARRLLFAVPVGLFFGGKLMDAFNTDESGSGTMAAVVAGMGLSLVLFLGIIWLLGRRRRAAFAASGGDPDAAGVLLFGAMAPRSTNKGSGGSHGDGGGSASGGDSGCGGGGGGGDGGGCD